MKKILLITGSNMSLSGVSVVYMSIVRELHKDFIFDIIICENDDMFFEKEFLSYGGNIFFLKCPQKPNKHLIAKLKWLYFDYPKKINEFLKNNIKLDEYAAVHSFQELFSTPFLKAAKKAGINNRILHINSALSAYPHSKSIKSKFMYNYRKKSFKLATNILFVSESALKYNNYKNKGIVLYNIYNENKFGKILDSESGVLSLTQIGTLSSRKNQLFSLNVLKKITETYPEAILNIVGKELEHGYFSKMNEYISINNLHNNVKFLAADTDRIFLSKKTSFVLYPSILESFGLVLIESQASGIHCFANIDLPRDADMGNVDFLELDSDLWAKSIIRYYKKNGNTRKKPRNKSRFSRRKFINTLSSLYNR